MTRQQKIELMLWRARELAALGYQPAMIETALVADGFCGGDRVHYLWKFGKGAEGDGPTGS